MNHAAFRIEQEALEYILIRDIGPWDKHPTVTNDAESIVETLARGCSLGSRRLFYIDSEGQIDELLHTTGKFAGFKAGHEGVSLEGK